MAYLLLAVQVRVIYRLPYLDKNAGNHQSVAAGILLGCFLADIG